MKIISKWFWRLLQHISAPSEKELRERLIGLMVCLIIGLAPAYAQYSYIKSPEQYRADRQAQIERDRKKLIEDETMAIVLELYGSLSVNSNGKLEGRLSLVQGDFSLDAISKAREIFESKGWLWGATIPNQYRAYELYIKER